jgi:hypothetical protein
MKRRFIRWGALSALVVLLALGEWMYANRRRGHDERPVTLLSEQVTLGPKALIIEAPRGTNASGTSFWLTIYLDRQRVCEGSEWSKEEAERLPVLHGVAVTSDGQRYPMDMDPCCAWSVCGALTLYGHTPDPERRRRLVRIELSAPEAVPIEKVTWASWQSEIKHLGR